MQCTRPVRLYVADSNELLVPCGKCRACRISRSREWATRIVHEMSYHNYSTFLTLTYTDDYLPSDQSVKKEELQRFYKRLRKSLGDRKIKYYSCGEYGSLNKRPHYHAIVFGLKPGFAPGVGDYDIVEKAWGKGRISLDTVTYQSARYVADYIQKDNRRSAYQGREPPFSLMSKGIGKTFCVDNGEMLKDNLGCTIDGANVGLPKYYRKVLGLETEDLADMAKERHDDLEKVHRARVAYNNKNSDFSPKLIYDSVSGAKRQHDRNLRSKEEMKRKKKL